MNLYQKINKSILERFPTMWNTHFVWMILICLLTHVLFFALGFAALNIEILKEYGVRNIFFKGSYFSFYAIIGLLAIIYFGFRYFTHNPFKNFYPVSKLYFWKILGQLFVIFFLFGSIFISFENGVKLKAKTIVPAATVQKEAEQIALAKPFLYNDKLDYAIKNRSFPEPFPCDDVENLVIGYDSANDLDIKHGIDYKKPYINFTGGGIYQFGKLKEKRIDSCTTKEVLDTIFDVSKIYGLAEYSFYNYNGRNFNSNRKYIDDVSTAIEEDIELEKIHNWQKNKDSVAIAKAILAVKDICNKYNIKEQLNPMKMATVGLKQNLDVQQLIRTGFVDYKNYTLDQVSVMDAAGEAVAQVAKENKVNRIDQIEFNYFANLPEFTRIEENVENIYENMGTNQLKSEAFWVLFFGSLGFAMFFVMAKYIALKDLLIGVAVAGVLLAILGLYVGFTERFDNSNGEERVMRTCIFYAAIIMATGFYGFFSSGIKKHLLTKWFVAFGVATVGFFPTLLSYIYKNAYIEVADKCSTGFSKVYNFELHPWQFVVLALLSIFIIFTMLRKMYAKVE